MQINTEPACRHEKLKEKQCAEPKPSIDRKMLLVAVGLLSFLAILGFDIWNPTRTWSAHRSVIGEVSSKMSNEWTIAVSEDFDVLGPFPLKAREQHFLSPSYPIKVGPSYTHNASATYLSSLPDGGQVTWSNGKTSTPGQYQISYPDIRWASIRETQGWASLQHHSILRSTITISPSNIKTVTDRVQRPTAPHSLAISVKLGSFFAILPRGQGLKLGEDVAWYPGDIYGLGGPPHLIPLPTNLSLSSPFICDIFISVDYEIRLFGDPHAYAPRSETPRSVVNVAASLEQGEDALVVGEDHVFPDVVGGWMLGDALGIELKSLQGEWIFGGVDCSSRELDFSLNDPTFNISSGQTRRISLKINQAKAISDLPNLDLTIRFSSRNTSSRQITLIARINLHHIPALQSMTPDDLATLSPLKQTYWAPHASQALIVPPLHIGAPYTTPIIALHGAGVELTNPFWPAAIPRQDRSWVIIPSGGSSWGYDWRGPSLQDILAAVSALRVREPDMPAGLVVIGHSNGGQGTFHLASRYPDLVHSSMPAAAYQSAPLYVPETYSHGRYWVDPTLDSILKSSTAGGDNDRFLGNLVRGRVRVVHGGDDGNVPVWHGRAAVQTVKDWSLNSDIELIEVPQKDHWFADVFTHPQRSAIIADFASTAVKKTEFPQSFTLTVLWPRESGAMGGYRILDTKIHGRFASARIVNGTIVRSTNIRILSYQHPVGVGLRPAEIVLDSQPIQLGDSASGETLFRLTDGGTWEEVQQPLLDDLHPYAGPISRVLVSETAITIVVASDRGPMDVAKRLAWALYTYLALDIAIVSDDQMAEEAAAGVTRIGSVIVMSAQTPTIYGQSVLGHRPSEFRVAKDGSFELRGRHFSDAGTALLFMHSRHLFMHGTDLAGLERAFRAFPFRTGTPCPEWIILAKEVDTFSYGGILGAGFWGSNEISSDVMSWLA
ncbi:hypothetical protein FRB93_011299 [Tulasnella sp. JGI-2019a]|nr:hypothetical protein FRB93_011299 [Tulasnella sp. JGI-2019a]